MLEISSNCTFCHLPTTLNLVYSPHGSCKKYFPLVCFPPHFARIPSTYHIEQWTDIHSVTGGPECRLSVAFSSIRWEMGEFWVRMLHGNVPSHWKRLQIFYSFVLWVIVSSISKKYWDWLRGSKVLAFLRKFLMELHKWETQVQTSKISFALPPCAVKHYEHLHGSWNY